MAKFLFSCLLFLENMVRTSKPCIATASRLGLHYTAILLQIEYFSNVIGACFRCESIVNTSQVYLHYIIILL